MSRVTAAGDEAAAPQCRNSAASTRADEPVLVHVAGTVQLAGLDRELREELKLRAACALRGEASPHQVPPSRWLAIGAAVAAVAGFYLIR